ESLWEGFISFKMETLVRLAVQGTLNILRHTHISKASILFLSLARITQVSEAYEKIGKIRALTRCIFVFLVILRSFQILVILIMAERAISILRFISNSQEPEL
ncbi:hypothetical protein, partial [Micromonospora noduli]|uniref:hypothetical protein n=1 Tax=Micromonospora noduli TaxID=709876 RepID=UPI001B87F52F